jgi:hypothetical protein
MSRILRRLVPSPAMIVALVALVLSLGGSAYALVVTGKTIRNNTVTGKDIRNRSLSGNDVKGNRLGGGAIKESSLATVPSAGLAASALGVDLWAVINSDGVLVRGRGQGVGDPASRTNTGIYDAVFNRDVRNCAYFAVLGAVGTGGPPQGQVSVTSHPTNVNAVRIRTENDGGAVADKSFHLIVIC